MQPMPEHLRSTLHSITALSENEDELDDEDDHSEGTEDEFDEDDFEHDEEVDSEIDNEDENAAIDLLSIKRRRKRRKQRRLKRLKLTPVTEAVIIEPPIPPQLVSVPDTLPTTLLQGFFFIILFFQVFLWTNLLSFICVNR